jgi:hypothetical protein
MHAEESPSNYVTEKIVATIIWDVEGVLRAALMECGTTIICHVY